MNEAPAEPTRCSRPSKERADEIYEIEGHHASISRDVPLRCTFNFSRGESMSNQRGTFAKRQREADLKEKARAKQARRMAKRSEVRTTKGPEMGEPVVLDEYTPGVTGGDAAPAAAEAAPAAPVAPGAASSAAPSDPTE